MDKNLEERLVQRVLMVHLLLRCRLVLPPIIIEEEMTFVLVKQGLPA